MSGSKLIFISVWIFLISLNISAVTAGIYPQEKIYVDDPLQDFLQRNPLREGEQVYQLSVDMNNDGRPDFFFTTSSPERESSSFSRLWDNYVSHEKTYLLGSLLNGDGYAYVDLPTHFDAKTKNFKGYGTAIVVDYFGQGGQSRIGYYYDGDVLKIMPPDVYEMQSKDASGSSTIGDGENELMKGAMSIKVEAIDAIKEPGYRMRPTECWRQYDVRSLDSIQGFVLPNTKDSIEKWNLHKSALLLQVGTQEVVGYREPNRCTEEQIKDGLEDCSKCLLFKEKKQISDFADGAMTFDNMSALLNNKEHEDEHHKNDTNIKLQSEKSESAQIKPVKSDSSNRTYLYSLIAILVSILIIFSIKKYAGRFNSKKGD